MSHNRLLDYLKLVRLPNVFTAVADVSMGFLFVGGSSSSAGQYALLLTASCSLYLAGMVLNDVFDIEVDRVERPTRPLPTGRISLGRARSLGIALLLIGLVAAAAGGMLMTDSLLRRARPALIAAALVLSILLYDGWLKKNWAGPIAMGGCRFWNVLLGMSVANASWNSSESLAMLFYTPEQLVIAAGIGIYIAGVTLVARKEAATSPRPLLAAGVAVMIVGLLTLASFPHFSRDIIRRNSESNWWPLSMILVGFTVVMPAFKALHDPRPQRVQHAVKHAILSLIVIDAAVVLYTVGHLQALAILCLLIPTLAIGRWVYST